MIYYADVSNAENLVGSRETHDSEIQGRECDDFAFIYHMCMKLWLRASKPFSDPPFATNLPTCLLISMPATEEVISSISSWLMKLTLPEINPKSLISSDADWA